MTEYPASVDCPKHLPRRSEEHTSELQSHLNVVCRLLLGKKKRLKLTEQNADQEEADDERQYEVGGMSDPIGHDRRDDTDQRARAAHAVDHELPETRRDEH